jgi:hypothetical protein
LKIKQYCSFLLVVSLIFLAFNVGVGHSLPENGTINVPYSTNVPTIDGAWTSPVEWQGASENPISNQNNMTAYLRIEHNGTYLFILIDFISDQTNSSSDNVWIYFDTKDDGGTLPQTDDYVFDITGFRQGTGSATGGSQWVYIATPAGAIMAKGFSHLNDPYDNATVHEIYEFRVPCSFLGAGHFYGFYAVVIDSSTFTILHWPVASADSSDPNVWGDIYSATQFVPELSPSSTIALFLLITLVAVVLFRRKRARSPQP